MKVKLIVARGGNGFTQNPGDIVEVSNEVGARMIERFQAEPVAEKREKATKSKREKRVK